MLHSQAHVAPCVILAASHPSFVVKLQCLCTRMINIVSTSFVDLVRPSDPIYLVWLNHCKLLISMCRALVTVDDIPMWAVDAVSEGHITPSPVYFCLTALLPVSLPSGHGVHFQCWYHEGKGQPVGLLDNQSVNQAVGWQQ